MKIRTLFTTLLASAMVLTLQALPANSAGVQLASDGSRCTKLGTNGNDVIRGTSGRDVICGFGGNDKIYGLGGDDIIDGGTGNDIIDGGVGNDSELGGTGKDSLIGGSGSDSLLGGDGKDLFDGGAGLNSCDLDDSLGEIRDFTCSLLPNLAYLLHRVRGSIVSPGLNFDGCAIALHPYSTGGQAVVQSMIYDGGHFEFDAPAGDYTWLVRPADGGADDSGMCKVYGHFKIYAAHLAVSDSTPEVTFTVPDLVLTRIFVKNSLGTALRGATVTAGTATPAGSCPIPTNPSGLCANLDWIQIPKNITGADGSVQIMLPVGTRIYAEAQVRFAGITMNTARVFQDVVSGSTNINLVVR